MIPAIIIAFAALVGLLYAAYRWDKRAYQNPEPVPVKARPVKQTGTKAKQAYHSMAPSPPKSKQSLRRWTFDRLMASKYAGWRNPLPRRDRRAAAWLEAKARVARALEGQGSAK